MTVLDSVRDSSALLAELDAVTPIAERSQGSRSAPSREFLSRLESLQSAGGIVRVADISFLAASGYPVFQATRPGLIGHAMLGQNTGSQGRGTTPEAARISAIMETLEMHSAEPRNAELVRGSYAFLRHTQPILPLSAYHSMLDGAPPQEDEALLWTKALSVERRLDVLAPAEALFYALNARDYQTRPVFPASTNGLAGGSCLMDACLHGLYELLERYYFAAWQASDPKLRFERIRNDDLEDIPGFRELVSGHPGIGIGVFGLRRSGLREDLAHVVSVLIDAEGEIHSGTSCHHDARTAIRSSLGEAIQSKATCYSGAREDHAFDAFHPLPRAPRKEDVLSVPETLSLESFERGTSRRQFRSLQAEFEFLVAHVHRLGFRHVLVKNLTRVGLEVPIVRVLVPGMRMQAYCRPRPWSRQEIVQCQYCLDL